MAVKDSAERWPSAQVEALRRCYHFVMCGKLTAVASWSEVVAFSQPPIASDGDDGLGRGDGAGHGSNDEIVTCRVGRQSSSAARSRPGKTIPTFPAPHGVSSRHRLIFIRLYQPTA
jgi:hypothetical protein